MGVKGSVTVTFRNKWGRNRQFTSDYSGVVGMLQKRLSETESEGVKEWLGQFQADKPCPICKGKRLKPEALSVLLGRHQHQRPVRHEHRQAHDWFETLHLTNPAADDRAADHPGNTDAPGLFAQCRPGLSDAGPGRTDAGGRRGAADSPGLADRIGTDRRSLYPR